MPNAAVEIALNLASPYLGRLRQTPLALGMDGEPEKVLETLAWLVDADAEIIPVAGLDVIELGPGRTPDLLAAFLFMGARTALGLDVNLHIGEDARAPARYRRLVERLVAPENARVIARYGATSESVRDRYRTLSEAPLPLRFARYSGDQLPVAPLSADLIVSKSVFEHVRRRHIPSLLGSIAGTLRPGGSTIDIIDLRDHMFIDGDHREHGNWLDALTRSERVFDAMHDRRDTYINRLRASQWRRAFAEAGLGVTGFAEIRRALPANFAPAQLRAPWSDLSADELSVVYVTVTATPAPASNA